MWLKRNGAVASKQCVEGMCFDYENEHVPARVELVWTVSRVEIFFLNSDLWELRGAGEFLPKRTAARSVESERGHSPVLLPALLDTSMWEMSRLVLAANKRYLI